MSGESGDYQAKYAFLVEVGAPELEEEPQLDELELELYALFADASRSRTVSEGGYHPLGLHVYEALFRIHGVEGETERWFVGRVIRAMDDAFCKLKNERLSRARKRELEKARSGGAGANGNRAAIPGRK